MADTNNNASNRVFVIGVDMENRPAEEIAKDAAIRVCTLIDKLVEAHNERRDKNTV